MNWSYTTLKCALCLCVFAFLYFKHIWFQFKKSLRILCGLALSQEIVQETSFHHPFLTVSLVLSWWPPAFSFAVIVVWGARIMKRKNGWPFDCPQDSPPPLTTEHLLNSPRTSSTSSVPLPVRVLNGVKCTLWVSIELLSTFLSRFHLKGWKCKGMANTFVSLLL